MNHLNSKLNFIFFVLIIISLSLSCGPSTDNQITFDTPKVSTITFNYKDVKIDGDLKSFKVSWANKKIAEDIQIITLTLESDKAVTPPQFTVRWNTPSVDIYGSWTPRISLNKGSLYNSITSRAARYAPVVCLFNQQDQNRITLAVSDTLNKLTTGTWVKEEDLNCHFYVNFFSEKTPAIKKYQVQFRIDTRNTHFSQSLRDVARWWAHMPGQKPAPVPEFAYLPLYSTWYSFHQSITADEILKQCRLAKPLGFDNLIVDDGWQTMDSQRGYLFTGDWEPVRIGDMKSFVDRIHELGTKFMLWYSLPFIGEKAKNYPKFKGKYLRFWNSQGAWILDPRYPDVREHIIHTYEKAMKDWSLDGFKLDFMGWFAADDKTQLTAENGRDYASVDMAVDRLMTDIMARLLALNPNLMIEFRQPYIGPRMRKVGNMFRATDCPNEALINRVRITDIRLLCDNTAVHSDMYVWHNDEPVEQAALQLLNVLFSVPQLSIKLDQVSPEHIMMIKFWTHYWRDNRDVFLKGIFIPSGPHANYPIIRSRTADKTIIAVYDEVVVPITENDADIIDIVNGKNSSEIILNINKKKGKRMVKTYDCTGNLIQEHKVNFKKGVIKLTVPPSGLITISN